MHSCVHRFVNDITM